MLCVPLVAAVSVNAGKVAVVCIASIAALIPDICLKPSDELLPNAGLSPPLGWNREVFGRAELCAYATIMEVSTLGPVILHLILLFQDAGLFFPLRGHKDVLGRAELIAYATVMIVTTLGPVIFNLSQERLERVLARLGNILSGDVSSD